MCQRKGRQTPTHDIYVMNSREHRNNHIRIYAFFFYLVPLYLFAYSRRVHWPQSGGLFQGIGIHWWSFREGAPERESEKVRKKKRTP